MTNLERGKKLISESGELLKEAKRAYQSSLYNITVRRSQETVELALKGLLIILGIEYPKIHDVGTVFYEQVKAKGLKIEEKDLGKIKFISSQLTKEREASFYMEKDYVKEEAEEAKEDAEFVFYHINKVVASASFK
jgi:HEPN domain-containing protein